MSRASAPRPPLRVKVCGLTRPEDLRAAEGAGADYLGVVLTAGFARAVAPESASRLVEGVRTSRVAVLVDEDADGAEGRARALGAEVIQLHGGEPPELLEELRRRGPWTLWKAVRARALDEVERAVERYAGVADALLVEGWQPGGPGRGGARLELDPGALRRVVPEGLELVLAGGLGPDNVAEAVLRFRPHVVDASSALESSPGVKDAALVASWVRAAKGAVPRATGGPDGAAAERGPGGGGSATERAPGDRSAPGASRARERRGR